MEATTCRFKGLYGLSARYAVLSASWITLSYQHVTEYVHLKRQVVALIGKGKKTQTHLPRLSCAAVFSLGSKGPGSHRTAAQNSCPARTRSRAPAVDFTLPGCAPAGIRGKSTRRPGKNAHRLLYSLESGLREAFDLSAWLRQRRSARDGSRRRQTLPNAMAGMLPRSSWPTKLSGCRFLCVQRLACEKLLMKRWTAHACLSGALSRHGCGTQLCNLGRAAQGTLLCGWYHLGQASKGAG